MTQLQRHRRLRIFACVLVAVFTSGWHTEPWLKSSGAGPCVVPSSVSVTDAVTESITTSLKRSQEFAANVSAPVVQAVGPVVEWAGTQVGGLVGNCSSYTKNSCQFLSDWAYEAAQMSSEWSETAWENAKKKNLIIWPHISTFLDHWTAVFERVYAAGLAVLAAGVFLCLYAVVLLVQRCFRMRRMRFWTRKVVGCHTVQRGSSNYHLIRQTQPTVRVHTPSNLRQDLAHGIPVEVLTSALLPQPRVLRYAARRRVLYTDDLTLRINDLTAIQVGSQCDVIQQDGATCSRWSPNHVLGLVCAMRGTVVLILPEVGMASSLANELASIWSDCGRKLPVFGEGGKQETSSFNFKSSLSAVPGNRQHHFIEKSFTEASWCHVCDRFLFGLTLQGVFCEACSMAACRNCSKTDLKACPGLQIQK